MFFLTGLALCRYIGRKLRRYGISSYCDVFFYIEITNKKNNLINVMHFFVQDRCATAQRSLRRRSASHEFETRLSF